MRANPKIEKYAAELPVTAEVYTVGNGTNARDPKMAHCGVDGGMRGHVHIDESDVIGAREIKCT